MFVISCFFVASNHESYSTLRHMWYPMWVCWCFRLCIRVMLSFFHSKRWCLGAAGLGTYWIFDNLVFLSKSGIWANRDEWAKVRTISAWHQTTCHVHGTHAYAHAYAHAHAYAYAHAHAPCEDMTYLRMLITLSDMSIHVLCHIYVAY